MLKLLLNPVLIGVTFMIVFDTFFGKNYSLIEEIFIGICIIVIASIYYLFEINNNQNNNYEKLK